MAKRTVLWFNLMLCFRDSGLIPVSLQAVGGGSYNKNIEQAQRHP